MRLGDFITSEKDAILVDWERFAATQTPASNSMSRSRLRNHAAQMLDALAQELSDRQTVAGAPDAAEPTPPHTSPTDTASQVHAFMRAKDGFDINQMASEYRALRANVLRRWAAQGESLPTDLEDIVCFNEAIDQGLAESIASFSTEVERQRNLLLSMLGHDMRNPLQSMLSTSRAMVRMTSNVDLASGAERMRKSGVRMRVLLDDLMDFGGTQLGVGIRVARGAVNLAATFSEELELLRTAFPGAQIELVITGDVTGECDANRMNQVLGNLVTNALRYGRGTPVKVQLDGDATMIAFSVCNEGEPISPELIPMLFEPLKRGDRADVDGLGLGLYIVKQVVTAHAGEVQVTSSNGVTCFLVTIPRFATY